MTELSRNEHTAQKEDMIVFDKQISCLLYA